jgi:predicted amidohydrolase YtcJ
MAAATAGADDALNADLLLHNARIWTGDPDLPAATSIGIQNGRIVFVGNEIDSNAFVGPATIQIDAQGKRIIPGLIDSHAHLQGAANSLAILNLREARSREDLLSIIRRAAAEQPQDAWLIGRGWSAESWPDQTPPTADELDVASGNRPVLLTRMDGHSLVASRTALDLAGITTGTPQDPPGGKIERTAEGLPTGAIFEQAMSLVRRHKPTRTDDQLRSLLLRAQQHAHSVGITQVGAIESPEFLKSVIIPMDQQGLLTLRVQATISQNTDTLDEWHPSLLWASSNPNPSPNVSVIGFKGYMDGSLGSRTAWMHQPYIDNPVEQDNAGFPQVMAESGLLADLILQGAQMGLQPAVHAIGTRANEQLLDWYEQIPQDQRRAIRPRIEHAQHLLPEDVPRFAALGVIPSMQPYHKADDGRYADQRIGAARNRTSYAFRDLLDSGAALSFGSDWPVVSVNPFLGIAAAVNALTLDGETFLPEQSITIEEALTAYTRTAAWCLLNESETGMLRVGYLADMLILDRDILSVPPQQLADVRVLETYVGGKRVYPNN